MAVTVISSPNVVNSVFNPNAWVVNSSNKNKDGFRYIVEVYISDKKNPENFTQIKTFKVLPRASDGYGEFDLSKMLSDLTMAKFDFADAKLNKFTRNDKLRVDYALLLGEEYFGEWKYSDTEFVTGSKTKAVSNTVPPFIIGDIVQITPDNPAYFPAFSGVQRVTDIQGNDVYFDVDFISTPTNSGSLWYADNRKLRTMENSKELTRTALRARLPFYDWNLNKMSNYIANNNTRLLPMRVVRNHYLTPNQPILFPLYLDPLDYSIVFSNGLSYPIGVPANFNENKANYVYLSPSIMSPVPNDFTLKIVNGEKETPLTIDYSFIVDKNCGVNDLFLLYEDSLGAINSWAFKGFTEGNLTATKDIINKPITFQGSEYDPKTTRGLSVVDVDYSTEITLHGFSLPRVQDLLFEDVVKSANTWLFNATDNTIKPCVVVTASASLLDVNRRGLRRRDVTIKLSNE